MEMGTYETLNLLMLAGLLFTVIVQMLRASYLEGRLEKQHEALVTLMKITDIHQRRLADLTAEQKQRQQAKQGVHWTKPTLVRPIGDVEKGD